MVSSRFALGRAGLLSRTDCNGTIRKEASREKEKGAPSPRNPKKAWSIEQILPASARLRRSDRAIGTERRRASHLGARRATA